MSQACPRGQRGPGNSLESLQQRAWEKVIFALIAALTPGSGEVVEDKRINQSQ